MRYLTRGATPSDTVLSRHGEVITAVRDVLEARDPGMVEPNETFITGERDEVCILIIPHHWLGGVGLIVLSDPPGLDLRWAAVTDLSDHDQIDLGHVVDRWQLPVKRQMNQLVASLEQELSRPIEWMCTYRGSASSPRRIRAVLDINGRRVVLHVLSKLSLWPFPRREVVESTSLSSKDPPTFRLPVPIDRLLKQA